jgi:hypothetical protein
LTPGFGRLNERENDKWEERLGMKGEDINFNDNNHSKKNIYHIDPPNSEDKVQETYFNYLYENEGKYRINVELLLLER